MSNSLRPYGLQHSRLPCPSPSPGVCSNSHPLNRWCYPTSSSSVVLPTIRVFSNELAFHIKWPKCWSFSNSPSNEYSGLISFRIDWFDLFAVQGTLKSLLQHHSSKAQPSLWSNSHPYMTTGKTVALTVWTFVSKVASLLFKMLSKLIIAFLPRSKRLLISYPHREVQTFKWID